MTISLLGTAATNSDASVTSISASHTLDSGVKRIAIAFVSFYDPSGINCTGVTYGGVSMTQIGFAGSAGVTYRKVYAFYILEASLPSDGSKTVVANFDGLALNANLHVFTIQNAKQQAYETYNTFANGSAETSSVSLTTVADNAWAFSCAIFDAISSFTHGASQAEITDTAYTGTSSTRMTMSASYKEVALHGSTSMSSTCAAGSDRHAMVAFSFAPEPPSVSSGLGIFAYIAGRF